MGYRTHFHGSLQFARDLSSNELRWLNRVLNASHTVSEEIRAAIWQKAKDEQTARGGGPLMFHGRESAQQSANMSGFITGEGLHAGYAGDLRISDDYDGLVYCAEKTYDMVAGVNFIIINARTQIPDFALKGELLADTEFEPGTWLVEINSDGLAHQREISREEFFEKRRKLYPEGYEGFGRIDPERDQRGHETPPYTYEDFVETYRNVIRAGNDQRGMFYAEARKGMLAPFQLKAEQFGSFTETEMDMTVAEARAVGRWLCKRADEIAPQRGMRAWLARRFDI